MSLTHIVARVRWTALSSAAVAVAALAVAVLAVTGCSPSPQAQPADHPVQDHPAHDHSAHGDHAGHADHDSHAELPADEPAAFSIYHAASVWTDQNGEERPIGSLEGRVQVVGMVYTNCAYACPRMVLDMKRIEADLGSALVDRVGFVLVSIDPERDTPERLGEFARGSRLDPDRWTLLHGDDGDILELAALLGVQYRRMTDGEFVHSNLLTVLDQEGQVVHRQLGLDTDPAATLSIIRSLIG